MSVLAKLLSSYSENHQNPINELIHIFAIPLIMFSIVGLVSALNFFLEIVLVVIVFFYYLKLSKIAAILMLGWLVAYLVLVHLLEPYILAISVTLFTIGWLMQFIGHSIEGKRPSFFEDLRHFLIGPLFVLHKIFLKFGIRVFVDAV